MTIGLWTERYEFLQLVQSIFKLSPSTFFEFVVNRTVIDGDNDNHNDDDSFIQM